MRTEEIIAKALEQTSNDRYVLANMVFVRVKQLENGARPLVTPADVKVDKLSDIAMREIAEGKIHIEKIS
ncbi:DNA-directed RNA polymerase subunit omega [Helicobacter mustelae]|uniref:DNA-directed RNA polymerase subunit omega n=1 Tax=Helicobacter mustelae (strain ATCC 43772 / CCUG 25715 / CIP 103759 / LMG 18044 / NCTC 12198 / R85-136P) TaxID=679897 RepID=D3UH81_HELM1|nr:DNA-directed RNA polymerase subunit omega [Helicobacter mustelae]CBG39853.1 putative DNA-directed RNA polymerase omega chain [Helicobacter mustelae 12198]SQH71362.1 DNA-directed RNA polymerase subunit omega [Helicobacter mustelae]STP12489.1 DNA-directed RNA polymerase subunit omega [Helicobacter mustelae]